MAWVNNCMLMSMNHLNMELQILELIPILLGLDYELFDRLKVSITRVLIFVCCIFNRDIWIPRYELSWHSTCRWIVKQRFIMLPTTMFKRRAQKEKDKDEDHITNTLYIQFIGYLSGVMFLILLGFFVQLEHYTFYCEWS